MVQITENTVMDFFQDLMKKDEIQYLVGKDEEKKCLNELINKLKDVEEIHDKILIAKDLWKALFEAAMVYIDPDKQGYDELFNYFDEFVSFEEVIYGADDYYRDHTLHSLWVYFLGEYIFNRPEYEFLLINFNQKFRQAALISKYYKALEKPAIFGELCAILDRVAGILNYDDAMRCVISLTHDLGYPLRKIEKINTAIGKVLPFFSISSFGEFSFQFETIQQFYIENLLELLSFRISFEVDIGDISFEERQLILGTINKINQITAILFNLEEPDEEMFNDLKNTLSEAGEKEDDLLRRIYTARAVMNKEVSTILRFSNDFEHYQHGIMSSYLLMKSLNAFSNIRISYSNPSEISVENMDIARINSKLYILRAMADHTSPGFQISDFLEHSDVLILIDDIEEFSRISRANQYRQFVNEFCKTDLNVKDGWLLIDNIFEDETVVGLDPEIHFRDKCKKFMRIFEIRNLADHIKIRFRCIGKLPTNNNIYELKLQNSMVSISINNEPQVLSEYLKTKEAFHC
jgi:hypothetical protein